MASKIAQLKDQLVEQTEMIQTLRTERDSTRDMMKKLYITIVKYKPEFQALTGQFTEASYPNLRAEDATRDSNSELARNVGAAFGAITVAVKDMHKDLSDMYRELDQSVDDAMDKWRTVRAQEINESKASAFRGTPSTTSQNQRAQTPEVPLVSSTRVDSAASTPPTVVGTEKKIGTTPASPVEKKKPAQKLGSIMDGIATAASKTSKK